MVQSSSSVGLPALQLLDPDRPHPPRMGDDTVRDIEFHCVHRGDPVELLRPLAAPALPPVVDPVIRVVMASPQNYGAHILINRGGEELGTFVVPPGHWRFAHAGHSKWTPVIAEVEADNEAWLVTMLVGDEGPNDRRFFMSETPCDILAAVLKSDAAVSVHNDALYLFLYRAGWLAERFGLPLGGPICPADLPCEGQAPAQR